MKKVEQEKGWFKHHLSWRTALMCAYGYERIQMFETRNNDNKNSDSNKTNWNL